MRVKLCGYRPCSGLIVDADPRHPRIYCRRLCAARAKNHIPGKREPRYCRLAGCPASIPFEARNTQVYCCSKHRDMHKADRARVERKANRVCKLDGCTDLLPPGAHPNQRYCCPEHHVTGKNKTRDAIRAAKRKAKRAEREAKEQAKRAARGAKQPKRVPTLGDRFVPPADRPGPKQKVNKPIGTGCNGCIHARVNPHAETGLECAREVFRACNPYGAVGPRLKEWA